MKAPFLLSAAIIVCALGIAQTACGAGTYTQVKYPPSKAADELQIGVTYTIWIPDGVKQLRGIIVHQHGAGTTASIEGGTAAYDLHWQALAKKWDCALLGPSYHVTNEKTDTTPGGSELWFDPRRGSDKVFQKGLADLAAKSGHPELTSVPWALWGHSGGGIWSDVMAGLHPERVAAVWLRSGTALRYSSQPELKRPAALYTIPMMANPGEKEKPQWMKIPGGETNISPEDKKKGAWLSNFAAFKEFRSKGAPVGFAPDPRSGHECADARYLAIPFFDACLAMRLPEKGSKDQTLKPVDMSNAWYAQPSATVSSEFSIGPPQPANAFKGNPKEAIWLPNEAVAKAWMEYTKTGAVGDTTPPPAPTNVRVSANDNKREITWEAEADFESGLRCFIVLRDGQELAQVPKTPKGPYGRPLFQSMTYHDTPSKPLPEMRYIDASAKAGEKHEYAVIAVNSVGLKSQPSGKPAPPYDVFPPADPPYYRVRYEASTPKGELVFPVNYTIWIPEGVTTLRGVIVHQHGCGEGSCKSGLTGAYDLHWQALAKKHDCALLSPSYEQPEAAECQLWCDPRNGSDAAFQKGLVDLAAKSGHPELPKLPWAFWGHSGGGHWTGGMTLLHPERVIAAWLRSGVPTIVANPKRPTAKLYPVSDAALKVPMLNNVGTKEGVTVKDDRFSGVWPGNEAFFKAMRAKGALIGVAVDPLTSHECGNQRYLAIPWLDLCLSARLPKFSGEPLRAMPTDQAWLAPATGSEAAPAAKFDGDPLTAAWLPNETFAKAWMQYVKDTAVADLTPPPPPTNVRLKGNELTWNAEADLESGLASFLIERDGKFLAQLLPEKGKNPYGRPIFQNNQYSDTPTQPLVPMRYTDTTAEAGKKHTYRVIAVNTVDLKSMPSADTATVNVR